MHFYQVHFIPVFSLIHIPLFQFTLQYASQGFNIYTDLTSLLKQKLTCHRHTVLMSCHSQRRQTKRGLFVPAVFDRAVSVSYDDVVYGLCGDKIQRS